MTDKKRLTTKPLTPECLDWLDRSDEYTRFKKQTERIPANQYSRTLNIITIILILIMLVTCIGLIMIYAK